MRLVHALVVCALVLAVPPGALLAGQGKKGPKKDQPRPVRGIVVEVRKDADKDNGSLIVRFHKKKKNSRDRDELRQFQIIVLTKFAKVHEGRHEHASFRDVHEGQHVVVSPLEDRPQIARLVVILKDPR